MGKEAVSLLKEEVIFDELGLVLFGHALEGVELPLKVAAECAACIDHLIHDFEALLLRYSWSKRVPIQVPPDSDASGDDHGCVLLREVSVLEFTGIHV